MEELFNLRYQPSEMALDYLADAVSDYGLVSTAIEQQPSLVIIRAASLDQRLLATIRVQRLDGNFAIEATLDGGHFLPAAGDWPVVCKYCSDLKSAYDEIASNGQR